MGKNSTGKGKRATKAGKTGPERIKDVKDAVNKLSEEAFAVLLASVTNKIRGRLEAAKGKATEEEREAAFLILQMCTKKQGYAKWLTKELGDRVPPELQTDAVQIMLLERLRVERGKSVRVAVTDGPGGDAVGVYFSGPVLVRVATKQEISETNHHASVSAAMRTKVPYRGLFVRPAEDFEELNQISIEELRVATHTEDFKLIVQAKKCPVDYFAQGSYVATFKSCAQAYKGVFGTASPKIKQWKVIEDRCAKHAEGVALEDGDHDFRWKEER